jgi:transcriptional regulator with XRE-family HTH domain
VKPDLVDLEATPPPVNEADMGSTILERAIAERQRLLRRTIADELRRVRFDEGLSQRSVAGAAGLHHSHLPRIETGQRQASLDALVALATAMGHEVSVRLYPGSGPRVRDHIQVRMIEVLLAALHPRWFARLEVAVYRPVRGVIDVVLQDRELGVLVAGESHSVLHSVERQVRWAGQKADALDSARGWPWPDRPDRPGRPDRPPVGRLLLLRSTAATRSLVRALPATLETAYPAGTADAVEALTGSARPWPGNAIVWVQVDGAATRLLAGPPRGVRT